MSLGKMNFGLIHGNSAVQPRIAFFIAITHSSANWNGCLRAIHNPHDISSYTSTDLLG